jgi:hypothetical protein
MGRFTEEELRQRAFERAAWVLKHFWEEQQDKNQGKADVHSRLFDTLVYDLPVKGRSINGGGHTEHLVPCALLRDHAFKMFWEGKSELDVALMLRRLLCIAYITPAEARLIDHELGLKTTMPDGWDFETGSVMARLEAAGIQLELDD